MVQALLAGTILLTGCATTSPSTQLVLKRGASRQEVVKAGGTTTVKFSYQMNGRKYDLATLDRSPNPVVFEDSRLLAVLPPDTMNEWDRRLGEHLKSVDLPFESGLQQFHWWLTARTEAPATPSTPPGATTAADVAQAAAAGAILAPIAPILLAGGVVGASQHAMTGGDRRRAQAVNDGLLASGGSYGRFLAQFDRADFQTAKGTYQIREYLATRGSFFTGRDFFYDVGFRNGKVVWVAYEIDAIRFHAVRYWDSQRAR